MGKAILSGDVSSSDKLAGVSDRAALLWSWLLPHVNSWGQMDGSPGSVRARVAPRRKWTDAMVEGMLCELHNAGLIILYSPPPPDADLNSSPPDRVILVTNWEKYQRLDRRSQAPEYPMPTARPGNSGKLLETPSERKGKERKGKDKTLDRYSEGFNLFWKAYPKKIGKGAAWKAWGTAKEILDGKATIIFDKLKEQAPTWTDPRFIPHPATWLNQRRWEDEATPTVSKIDLSDIPPDVLSRIRVGESRGGPTLSEGVRKFRENNPPQDFSDAVERAKSA